MTNKINNGDMPAMPMDSISSARAEDGYFDPFAYGMTKREYFAAMAMQGMLSKAHRYTDFQLAEAAVKRADALLKVLEANNG